MTSESDSPALSKTVTYRAHEAHALTGADLLLAGIRDDLDETTEILTRTAGHHGPVVATAFRWVLTAVARSLNFDGLPLLPRDSAFVTDRARNLIFALSRNAVAGVDVPRALRASLRMTGKAWVTDPRVLVLDTTDPEAIAEAATVCIELAMTAAEQLGITPEEYVAGAVRVATRQTFDALAGALGNLG